MYQYNAETRQVYRYNSSDKKLYLCGHLDDDETFEQWVKTQEIINAMDQATFDSLCGWCNGSGEGMQDGTSCPHCKGKGVEP